MRYKQLISGAFLLWTCIACSGKKEQAATVAEAPPTPWDKIPTSERLISSLSPRVLWARRSIPPLSHGSRLILLPRPQVGRKRYFTPGIVSRIEEIHTTLKGIRRGIHEDGAPFHISIIIQHEMDREKFCQ